jgi:hypothetical protein
VDDNVENEVIESLIEPYSNKETDEVSHGINATVIEIAKNPRGQRAFYGGIPFLNLTIERIELVHRINIEI